MRQIKQNCEQQYSYATPAPSNRLISTLILSLAGPGAVCPAYSSTAYIDFVRYEGLIATV